MPTFDEDKRLFPRSYVNIVDQLVEDVERLKRARGITSTSVTNVIQNEVQTIIIERQIPTGVVEVTTTELGITRWSSDGTAVFELPDVWFSLIHVSINGVTEDPLLYALSGDGTQLVFDDNTEQGDVVFAIGEIMQI